MSETVPGISQTSMLGEPLLSSATVVSVTQLGSDIRVVVEADPVWSDDEHREIREQVVVEFTGVESVLAVRPEGMLMLGLTEWGLSDGLKRYVFTNWYDLDPSLPSYEAELAERRLDIVAREVRVQRASDPVTRDLYRQLAHVRKIYEYTAIVVTVCGGLLLLSTWLGNRESMTAEGPAFQLRVIGLTLLGTGLAMDGVSRLALRDRPARISGIAWLAVAAMMFVGLLFQITFQ